MLLINIKYYFYIVINLVYSTIEQICAKFKNKSSANNGNIQPLLIMARPYYASYSRTIAERPSDLDFHYSDKDDHLECIYSGNKPNR